MSPLSTRGKDNNFKGQKPAGGTLSQAISSTKGQKKFFLNHNGTPMKVLVWLSWILDELIMSNPIIMNTKWTVMMGHLK